MTDQVLFVCHANLCRSPMAEHIARRLLDGATLVLTATRRHRSVCAVLAPAALPRTFTLRQFARLAAVADPPAGAGDRPLRAAVEAALRARARVQPLPDGGDDLPDPLGGTVRDFTGCAEQIERAVAPIAAFIAAAG